MSPVRINRIGLKVPVPTSESPEMGWIREGLRGAPPLVWAQRSRARRAWQAGVCSTCCPSGSGVELRQPVGRRPDLDRPPARLRLGDHNRLSPVSRRTGHLPGRFSNEGQKAAPPRPVDSPGRPRGRRAGPRVRAGRRVRPSLRWRYFRAPLVASDPRTYPACRSSLRTSRLLKARRVASCPLTRVGALPTGGAKPRNCC